MIGTWETYESNHLPTLDVANYGASNPKVNMAGGYEGEELPTDGWAGNTKVLNKGQIFTIANVGEIQPRGDRRKTGNLQSFVVLEDVTSAAGGAATIKIAPELNEGTMPILDAEGNTIPNTVAFKTVTAKAANDAIITVIGTVNTEYLQSLFFERSVGTYVSVELEKVESAPLCEQSTYEGISITVYGDFNINDVSQTLRGDTLFGATCVDPRLGIRHIGSALTL